MVGPGVLPHECGERKGQTHDGDEAEAFYFLIGAASGHGGGAEQIDVALDDHVGNADDAALKTGGKAVGGERFQAAGMEADASGRKTPGS